MRQETHGLMTGLLRHFNLWLSWGNFLSWCIQVLHFSVQKEKLALDSTWMLPRENTSGSSQLALSELWRAPCIGNEGTKPCFLEELSRGVHLCDARLVKPQRFGIVAEANLFPGWFFIFVFQLLHIQIALTMRRPPGTSSKRTPREVVTSVSKTSNRRSLDAGKSKLLNKVKK